MSAASEKLTSPQRLVPQRLRGQRKTQDPCETCGLHQLRCLCSEIPRLQLRTRVSLIVHTRELRRTSNTGRLAVAALVNSDMHIRGLQAFPLQLQDFFKPQTQGLLLFPSEDAVDLTPDFVKGFGLPIHLVVPDGNWRQASKVATRYPELKSLPRVKLARPKDAVAHLRAESDQNGMATLQAVALALGVCEGPSTERALLELYELKLARTLAGRRGGALPAFGGNQ